MNLIMMEKEGGSEMTVEFSTTEAEILAKAALMDPWARAVYLLENFGEEWYEEATRACESINKPETPVHLEGGLIRMRDFS